MPAATETVTETLQVMRHTVSPLKQKPSLGAVPWVVNAEPSDATQPEPPREVGINIKLSLRTPFYYKPLTTHTTPLRRLSHTPVDTPHLPLP